LKCEANADAAVRNPIASSVVSGLFSLYWVKIIWYFAFGSRVSTIELKFLYAFAYVRLKEKITPH
jgi:hypothetical protein